ncbi:MAG TPA: PAS domain S-box protein, partial [Longimicrobiales bacterium]|nr:PAS domain S-box protein [Longimicrobiales bacterium]
MKRRILIPLFAALAILIGTFTALLYWSQRHYLNDARARDRASVVQFFQNKVREDAVRMNATLTTLATNSALADRFVAGDRAGLLAAARPIFQELNRRQGITHLYFVTPDRVAFLRVHRPEQFGDTIPRVSTLQAVRTNRTSYGLELGRLRGLLTLRVVKPWYAGDRLLGYLELGEEITSLAQEMKAVLAVELFVTVEKKQLNRANWEAGMRMFERTPRWDDYPDRVLIDHTMAVPRELTAFLRQTGANRSAPLDVKVEDRRFFGAAEPLVDISNHAVGDLIFLRDFTLLVRNTNRILALSALVAVLVGLGSVLMLYAGTRRHFIEPLLELRSVAERAGQGELAQAAAAQRPDELGDLARSLNRMIVDLRNAQAEQTRLVLDAALDAVVTFDLSGQVIDWNRQAESLFGWSRGDAIGRSVFELVGSTGTRTLLQTAVAEYRDGGHGMFNRLIEERAERRGGESIPVELAIAPVASGSAVFFSAFIREISDRKRLEADLQAAQRLEAIGKLAGGIAHDFNNLITAIVGYTTAVQDTLAPGTQPYEDALEIRRAADRATSLVQQLLAFARKRVVQPRIVDVNDLVGSIDRMLRRLIGEHIQLDAVLDRGIWPVLADPGQLEQVLVNPAVNARDAMPEGGRVTVRTANVVISGAMPIEGAVPPGH